MEVPPSPKSHAYVVIAPDDWSVNATLSGAGPLVGVPVKAAVGPGYGALDDRLTAAIHIRFGLPAVTPAALKKKIKKADRISAWMEAVQIAGFSIGEADKFFGRPDPALTEGLDIHLRPPVEVRNDFTARHDALLGAMA